MSIIITAIASVLIFLSSLSGATEQPSQPVSQPASIECMEDMPCWDASTEGVIQGVMSPQEIDAWDAIADLPLVPANNMQHLEYAATLDHVPANLPLGYFVVGSDSQPQLVHMFQWVTYWDA